ncbi:MAG: glycosyltransferase, partial [Candidatus Falkowbacteria bacterium]|nr:glycosyltransferase [Candidatus Falkowbacteria bacterium]
MLIAIDASRANREHKTGTEWYSYYLIRWLARLDKDNQYLLLTDEPLRDGLVDLSSDQFVGNQENKIEYDKSGYQIIKSPYNNFKAKVLKWPFKFLWTQGRLSLEMFIDKPDVLFVPAHTLPFYHPRKSFVTIHDLGFARNSEVYDCCEKLGPANKFWMKILNFLVKTSTREKCGVSSIEYLSWSTRFGLREAYKVITISEFSKKDILDLYGNEYKNKIKVIYNGYNASLYKKTEDRIKSEEILKKYNIEGPYIFYIGRLDKKKNILKLIKAYQILRNKNKSIKHKLVLAGDAGFGFNDINYLVSDRDMETDVIMTGWIDEADVPYLYSNASAFIFPSYYEGFGIPLL